jgi:hypothetical protein
MIVDLPFSGLRAEGRPLKMGFFHISNNNLSIRRQCAREVGMYDLQATKSEDVEICFRVALSPGWVAWREDAAVVRHKGRRTLWGLITQMWGWGYYVGYPYAKTGIRGIYLYWLNGRKRRLKRSETASFPILVCFFATDFHLANLWAILAVLAVLMKLPIMALVATAGLAVALHGYLHEVRRAGFRPWDTIKLAAVHYLTDAAFTTATFLGALRHRIILVPCSIFTPEEPRRLDPGNATAKTPAP